MRNAPGLQLVDPAAGVAQTQREGEMKAGEIAGLLGSTLRGRLRTGFACPRTYILKSELGSETSRDGGVSTGSDQDQDRQHERLPVCTPLNLRDRSARQPARQLSSPGQGHGSVECRCCFWIESCRWVRHHSRNTSNGRIRFRQLTTLGIEGKYGGYDPSSRG